MANGGSWRGGRARLRQIRNQVVDQQLRQLNRLRTEIRRGVDVLLLGDSTCLFGRPGEADRAMIPEMISRELDGASVASLAGAGYSSRMHAETLRILGTLDERPEYVVTSTCLRTATTVHVGMHPVYRYRHSLELMSRITDARRPIRSLGRASSPSPADYAEFRALPVTTRWGRGATIGDFRSQLENKGPRPWPREREQVLFDYFHGEVITPDNPGLGWTRELGRQIAAYGVPAASYLTAPPVERGEINFPGEFAPFIAQKHSLLRDAFRQTAGAQWTLVDAGLVDEDYVDSQDATEHFAVSGRRKIAAGVADALRSRTSGR